MRWELIDSFDTLIKSKSASSRKKYTGLEDFFTDHDPGLPRVPEPLLIEMIAQTGGVLLGLGLDFKKEVILAKIENARFFGVVTPPCEFTVETLIEEEREEGAWVSGVVCSAGKPVAEARIFLMSIDSLDPTSPGKIVFNEAFLKHYDIYEVARRSIRQGLSA